MRCSDRLHGDLRDVQELRQSVLIAAEDHAFVGAFCCDECDGSVETFADGLVGTQGFELDVDELADPEQLRPVFLESGDAAGNNVGDVREEGEVYARLAAFECGQILPDLVCGEAEDGSDEAREGFGDAPERCLCAAAGG